MHKAEANTHLLVSVDGCWFFFVVGWGGKGAVVTMGHEAPPPETIMFVGSYRLPASSVYWITGTSVASR